MDPTRSSSAVEVGGGPDGSVVAPRGELDMATQGELRAALEQQAARGAVTLDLSGAALPRHLRPAAGPRDRGGRAPRRLRFTVLPGIPAVQRLFDVAGVTELVPFADARGGRLALTGAEDASRRLELLMAAGELADGARAAGRGDAARCSTSSCPRWPTAASSTAAAASRASSGCASPARTPRSRRRSASGRRCELAGRRRGCSRTASSPRSARAPACCSRCARAGSTTGSIMLASARRRLRARATCATCRCSPGGSRSRSTTRGCVLAERQLEALVGGHGGRGHRARRATAGSCWPTPRRSRLLGAASVEELLATSLAELWERFALYDARRPADRATTTWPGCARCQDEPSPPPMLMRRVDRATGEQQWLLAKATVLHDGDGRPALVMNVTEDVTAVNAGRARPAAARRGRAGCSARAHDLDASLQEVAELVVPDARGLVRDRPARRRAGSSQLAAVAHLDPAQGRAGARLRARHPVARRRRRRGAGRDPDRRAGADGRHHDRRCCARPPRDDEQPRAARRRSASPRCWRSRCARATTCSARSRSSPRSRTGASTTPTRSSRRRSRRRIARRAAQRAPAARPRGDRARALRRPAARRVAAAAGLRGRGRLPAGRRGRARPAATSTR